MDDERIFGITKLKLQAFCLAALKMILWGHESHLSDGEVQHPDSRSLHD